MVGGRYSDAAKAAAVLSQLQALVFDDESFRPLVVKTDKDNKPINVPNSECAKSNQIISEHGDDIAHEVRRAWGEMQKYGHGLAAHTDRVPWHSKERRPLRVDEIVMLLSVACFKSEDLDNDAILASPEEAAESDDDVDNDDTVQGRFKRIVRDYDTLVEQAPMPKRNRSNQSGR